MPPINRFECNECGLELPTGWGGYTYAVNDRGQRIVCPHPGEVYKIREVTGMDYGDARAAGRTGHAQDCICAACLKQFDLDLDRDPRVCPACSSAEVRTLRELINQPCPRCKVGIIEQCPLVRWKLDPDWESLPIPQIVKDLTQFAMDREVPESLRFAAAATAERFDEPTFFVIALRLLGWWSGEYFSKSQEPPEFAEMRPQWTWCQALPAVLSATPALAELIVIRDDRCCFAETVSADTRRGIKNYVRKYHVQEVWT